MAGSMRTTGVASPCSSPSRGGERNSIGRRRRTRPSRARLERREDTMAHLIVEQTFDVPLTDDEHGHLGQQLDKCLEAYGARWMRSYLSTDRRRMVCEFDAADAEAVRTSYRSA